MKRHDPRRLGAALLCIAATGALPAAAEPVSPVQSSARPFGLDTIADVYLRGSDEASAAFQQETLPGLQRIVNENLSERQEVSDVAGIALNPTDLVLQAESELRVYFVGEGAGYRNTLGFFTQGETLADATDAALIFPDASSDAYYDRYDGDARSRSAPLAPGDFVDLGSYDAGTSLDFFLVGNGANGGRNTYYAGPDRNPDGIEHFVVLATPDSPFLLIGIEDLLGGGDMDYNDLVFALEVGVENAQKLIAAAVPLPPAAWAILGLGAAFGIRRVRQQAA